MKKIKLFLSILMIILLTGCNNKDLIKVHNNMQSGEGKINGYFIDLRISGTINDEKYNETVNIANYMDKDFKITIVNAATTETEDDVFYVSNEKVYKTLSEYSDAKGVKYANPLLYLEGLKNINKTTGKTEEEIGSNKYQVYNVNIKKSYIKKLLKEIDIEMEIDKKTKADVYVNAEGNLFRIKFYIKDLTVNVYYYGINNSNEIKIPMI